MIKDGQFYIDFPEPYKRRDLNSKYREIPLKDTTSRQLRKYFNAMANLYGIIPLRKAYEIISSQSPKLVTRDEFLAFSEIARHECEDYYILGLDELYVDGKLKDVLDREIIDVSLIGDGLDRYHALLKSQQGKPYYVPSKAQLLAYDDAFYCEPTEETNQMREFIETRLQLPEWKKAEVFDELVFGIRCADADFPQVQERLTAMGVHFPRRRDFQTFIERYQAFHNTTRMQSNRGSTPNELFDLLPREEQMPQTLSLGPNIKKALAEGSMNAEELRRGIMEADLPSEQLRLSLLKELAEAAPAKPVGEKKPKIGRNDPCPCGSGKKYKKCCGR